MKQNMNMIIKKIIVQIIIIIILILPVYAENLSPDELFYNFYGDFYEYIVENGGQNELLTVKVDNKSSFYYFVETNGKRKDKQGFGYVGDICGKYWGEPHRTDKGFLGYCLNNHKYIEYIEEWSRWFYTFRKAENMDIYYGESALDWLAYPHDTIVDITKWFDFLRRGVFNHYIQQ